MDMIKVDPKLFITCRLCLEELGMYQITPIVQQQIKFCFDIEVDPFDSLPQLICGKCESILSEYHTTKKIFIGKQNAIKARLDVRKEIEVDKLAPPQLATISSSQENDCESIKKYQKNVRRSKKRRILSSSSDTTSEEYDSELSRHDKTSKKKYNKQSKTARSRWEAQYTKHFICKFCGSYRKTKDSLRTHVKKHNYFLSQYRKIFEKHCTVNLIKTDNKPNITSSLNNVVLDQNKIINGEGDVHYYVAYLSNEQRDDRRQSGICETVKTMEVTHSESSDDNVFVNKKKIVRMTSNSSNDTEIHDINKRILADKVAVSADTECINIDDDDDLPDSESRKTKEDLKKYMKTKKSITAQVSDFRSIQNIISMCHSKYLKKMGCFESLSKSKTNKESQLKHKLLSMGLKVINKQGCTCTGLLRYLECRNLEINWVNTTGRSFTNPNNRQANYVHIMPKLKAKEQSVSANIGWKIISELDNNKNDSELIRKSNDQKYCMGKVSQAVLYPITESIDSDMKLLNASPVANPKQLPKKLNTLDCKPNVKPKIETDVSQNLTEIVQNNDTICIEMDDDIMNSNLCMPIITSTTSLAVTDSTDKNKTGDESDNATTDNNNIVHESIKSTPRIKVKHFSELMSERVLNNLSQCQDNTSIIWNVNQGGTTQGTANNHIIANGLEALKTTNQVPKILATSVTSQVNPSSEYVILDTVEFPNTKTNSPFRYLKDLLHMHNIILLHGNEKVTHDFIRLIKFKTYFSQESMEPIGFWLSLHCAENKFVLGMRDLSDVNNINIDKLTPNWQWEILKVCTSKEDVIYKLYQNAQRAGQQVHEYTKRFVCLLKSINLKAHAL